MAITDQIHRVVIIGGGFGGLDAARALRHAQVSVTLIDKRNYHLFQPMLYQVATGGLSPADISSPLRHILRRQRNTRVLLGTVTGIDPARKKVILDDGEVAYDSLIVASGAQTDFYGHDNWRPHALGLKTIEDALAIRNRIYGAFENAEKETDSNRRKLLMTFVIIGGGPTGVELAGALGEIAHDTLKHDFRSINPSEAEIFLIESGPRLLSSFPEKLSLKAAKALARLGVTVLLNHRVTDIQSRQVTVGSNGQMRKIDAATIVWGAGVKAGVIGSTLISSDSGLLDRAGRIKVDSHLAVPGHPEIFVIGDLSTFTQDGQPLPGMCPVAMSQGRYTAKTIARRLNGKSDKPYRYFNKGVLAVIGRASAVADFGFLRVSGYLAWLLWLFVHIMYLVEFENRLLVFTQWAWNYFTFNRGARLITGDEDLPPTQSSG